ncbi:hypothetical protein A8L45_07710 [Veronia pacifica]|uniref:non-specific protein-tyrosine kinase n=1 Tax=Veronia pacifica TaxID=1080227 RepID=A0A1C3ELN7_9GAMM|nr:hypothetical protein A8L45_07710 [Veronia pacifica]
MFHLGVLPKITGPTFTNRPIDHTLFSREDDVGFISAIRTIAAKLECHLTAHRRKVIAVTSARPSEGKSTTAMTLAQSLSESEKTLLIDADLRMSTLGMRFGLRHQAPGLTEVLLSERSDDELIQPTLKPNLDLLPAGRLSEMPSSLITSTAFTHLINVLQRRYDKIVIDTPPLHSVNDSLHLGKLAGGLLLVNKAGSKGPQILPEVIDCLKHHDIGIDGIVINQLSNSPEMESTYNNDLPLMAG